MIEKNMLYISQILQDPKIVKYEPKKVEVLYISQILQDPKTYKYHIIFFIIFLLNLDHYCIFD